MDRKNIAIVAGGNSGEYEVSIGSAGMIQKHINSDKFNTYLIVIKGNNWYHEDEGKRYQIDKNDFSLEKDSCKIHFDLVFNMIHGTPGEDGMLQGYLDMLEIPYTGSGRLCSSLTFHKGSCNRMVAAENVVNVANAVVLRSGAKIDADAIAETVGLPCFVKPNAGGSSVGMSKVKEVSEIETAILKAFKEDDEVLVESFVPGTEVTCAVMRKEGSLLVLPLTEIVSKKEFFDYEAKYEGASEEITPARISNEDEAKIKQISSYLYQSLDCKGVVRFDYILSNQGVFFLEVNTIPGMSEASIVPQMAREYGLSLSELVDILIEEAFFEHSL